MSQLNLVPTMILLFMLWPISGILCGPQLIPQSLVVSFESLMVPFNLFQVFLLAQ